MTRVRERTMSSDRTAFSTKAGNDKKKSSSSVLGRWFRSNSSNDNNDIDSGRIDLEKREGGKKSTGAVVTTNNSTGASRTESVTDNGSVYSSNSAFSVGEPPVAAPGVAIPSNSLKVPQDGVDGASVLGLYHVELHDESRISLEHDSNNNNNNNNINNSEVMMT
ncbi:hypothetical protein BGZ96_007706 [Linnemannia gamsii]|uniref:Uncharacterized protein n=1 Tax=Linnemannia gamsii TaxID=64522 RepID=A0ABQ7K0B3_9FUNG|nr:hypothetical protein BGZ96_007706 [Linnemannia gamsii]